MSIKKCKAISTNVKWLSINIVIGLLVLLFGSSFYLYKDFKAKDNYFYDSNLCRQRLVSSIADELGLDYQYVTNTRFYYPVLKVIANNKAMAELERLYASHNPEDNLNHLSFGCVEQNCHLFNVKHHVANINPKLLPHIPNNVDHVSYDPNGDNAVYCTYTFGENGRSQCSYLKVEGSKLIKDDISDIENATLKTDIHQSKHKENIDDYECLRSYVSGWKNDPNKIYGITLTTSSTRWEYEYLTQNY